MSDELNEVKKTTSENTVAIAELAIIAKRTSEDVDHLVKHIENMLPISTRVTGVEKRTKNLEDNIKNMWSGNLVKWIFTFLIAFNAYMMILVHDLDTLLKSKLTERVEKDKAFEKSINNLNETSVKEHKELRDELQQQQLYQGNNHTKIMGLTDRFNSKGGRI